MAAKPLIRCCRCGGGLVAPVETFARPDGGTAVSRHCPECDHRDLVVASTVAVSAWLAHEDRIRDRLETMADLLSLDPFTLYA